MSFRRLEGGCFKQVMTDWSRVSSLSEIHRGRKTPSKHESGGVWASRTCCSSLTLRASDSDPTRTWTTVTVEVLLTCCCEGRRWGHATCSAHATYGFRWMEAGRKRAIVWCSSHPAGARSNNGAGPQPLQPAGPPPPQIFSLPVRLITRNQSSAGLHDCVKVC